MSNKIGNYRKLKTTVEPLRHSRQIAAVVQLLKNRPRDLLLFQLGINSGLRVADLLNLRVFQVKDLPEGAPVRITETKTKKKNVFVLNAAVHRALHAHLSKAKSKEDDFLFRTKYGTKMTSIYAGRLIQGWCKTIGADGVFGCHTLRKTWAYHQRVRFRVDWALLGTRLNHSSPAVTKRYLGIEEAEVLTILNHVIE